jgi:hypothetical protein
MPIPEQTTDVIRLSVTGDLDAAAKTRVRNVETLRDRHGTQLGPQFLICAASILTGRPLFLPAAFALAMPGR